MCISLVLWRPLISSQVPLCFFEDGGVTEQGYGCSRLKVEWVSSLARLAHHLKWGLSQRIILQFNKLINVIWQVVSGTLGGVKAQFTIPFKSWVYYLADKRLDSHAERDDCVFRWTLWYSRSATSRVTLNNQRSDSSRNSLKGLGGVVWCGVWQPPWLADDLGAYSPFSGLNQPSSTQSAPLICKYFTLRCNDRPYSTRPYL